MDGFAPRYDREPSVNSDTTIIINAMKSAHRLNLNKLKRFDPIKINNV